MKRFFLLTAAAVAVMALGATAQDIAVARSTMQLKVAGPNGVVMGPAVKGAPYSGEEVTQSDQVLGDGTHIHNQNSTKVYRDSEGRVRRETSESITIFDPVAGASYNLNPNTMTARKMAFSFVTPNGEGNVRFPVGTGPMAAAKAGSVSVTVSAESDVAMAEAKARAEKLFAEATDLAKAKEQMAQISSGEIRGTMTYSKVEARVPGKKESLGMQVLEGVPSEGTRTTSTIEAGAIGNDRALTMVAERWYSQDLKTVMMTSHSDPRSGTETFRLTNVLRSEPSASLFQVSPDYKLVENPTGPFMVK
jgi:hypothetical protein